MKRSFAAGELMLRDDGRTVTGRIVPYNEPTLITEVDRDTNSLVTYREQFLPRSCLAMAQSVAKRGNAAFISFLMEHADGFDAKIGYATDLQDADDGAYGTFRLYENRDLLKVQSMLSESHTGLSVNFADTKQPRVIDDVVSRVQVHVDHVAATPTPCYATAGITGMRASDSVTVDGTPNLDAVMQWLADNRKVLT